MATFAFVFSGFLLDLDMQLEYRRNTRLREHEMSQTIYDLNEQMVIRQKLEADLISSREEISTRLSTLNTNLISLFDMVLISNESQDGGNLVEGSLLKIREILSCQALVFFKPEEKVMRLAGSVGLSEEAFDYLLGFKPDWQQVAPEVQVAPQPGREIGFPAVFMGNVYHAAAGKSIQIRGRQIGYLCALWESAHEFAVDEIIFINGTVDTFGLLFEYSRLNRLIADTAKMQERRRLAQDLHDSVTQSLQGLIFSAETAQVQQKSSPEKLRKTLDMILTGSRQALKEMRMLLYELRLSSISETNIVSLIRNRVAAVEKRAGVRVDFSADASFFLPKKVEAEMYPFMMEALNNSLKHAHAGHVTVSFEMAEDGAWIRIKDDGVGFDQQEEHPGGMGLKNMQERCDRVGASLRLLTQPGEGTSLAVFLPKSCLTNP
jgi:signal transduction histidine kinase